MKVNRTDQTSSESFHSAFKMSSVLQKMKRKKSDAREFQITASVEALTLECQKDVWHPDKLVIFWDKDNTNCHTKPVPWQPGVNNPFRGIHVWPEPDPVKTTSTLYKDNTRKGTYEDHPWGIVIKSESKSGKRKVIATVCIDLADYISETQKTFEITVTLKPANKNISSGTIEFTLTSVLLEDGIPYRPKEELLREILEEARREKKARRKAPRPPRPRPATRNKTPVPVGSLAEKKRDAKEVKSSLAQGNSEEKASNNGDKPLSSCRKGRKTKTKNSYPKELNPFGTSSEDARSLSPVMTSSPREISVRRTIGNGDGEEKTSHTGVSSLPERRKKRHGTKRAKKYPKELNPFDGSSDEEADTSSSKDPEIKEGNTTSSEVHGEQKSSKKSSFSDEAVVLKKSKPFRPESIDKTFMRDESSGAKAEDVVPCVDVDTGTSHADGAMKENSNQRSLSSEAVFSLRKNIPDYEDSPVIDDADHCVATASRGTGKKQREATTTDAHESIHGTRAAAELFKAKESDSTDKQKLACFFNKLLHPVPQKGFQHCPDLSAYAAEEINLLKGEIVAVEKVSIKLELEMREAMDIKDCKEEVDGLMQDWLILNDYRAELTSRKQNLQILDKQGDIEHCCDILRSEIKLLFKVEDWRKTAHHRVQEARLLDLLLSFVKKRRENC